MNLVTERRSKFPFFMKKKLTFTMMMTYLLLIVGSIVLMIPLIWMLSTSFKSNLDAMRFPIVWIPEKFKWSNYIELFQHVPFHKFIINSAYIAILSVLGTVVSSAVVAYGFARLNGWGKNILFILLLTTLMLPEQVTMIPQFILFRWLGWYDTSLPLWVPSWFASAFFVFMLRQFILNLSKELDDAAKIDGCNTFTTFYKIIVPMLKPALITVAVLSFFGSWNDFLRPLIYLQSTNKLTLAIALNMFKTEYTMYWNLTMAASVISVIPCIVIFFFSQKYLIEGFVVSGSGVKS